MKVLESVFILIHSVHVKNSSICSEGKAECELWDCVASQKETSCQFIDFLCNAASLMSLHRLLPHNNWNSCW